MREITQAAARAPAFAAATPPIVTGCAGGNERAGIGRTHPLCAASRLRSGAGWQNENRRDLAVPAITGDVRLAEAAYAGETGGAGAAGGDGCVSDGGSRAPSRLSTTAPSPLREPMMSAAQPASLNSGAM